MKILVLGGSGMLGHRLWIRLREKSNAYVTLRATAAPSATENLFPCDRTICNVIAENFDSVLAAFARVQPDVVINAIGIVKQHERAKDPLASLMVNSVFPQRLAHLCRCTGCRLIHLSTDCVFSGDRGNYVETDFPDPRDLYGQSKLLGEVGGVNCLTIRTSIIGHEIGTHYGLLEWMCSRSSTTVKGYRRARFSGLTTTALSELIDTLIHKHQDLHGIYHVAGEPISKYDLLVQINAVYKLGCTIDADDAVKCDRTLCAVRFNTLTNYTPPTWPSMIETMYLESHGKTLIRECGRAA